MSIWWFLIPALALSVLVVALVALGLRRGARLAAEGGPAREMRVYRDQLAEIDRDRDRGLIPEAEADRLRAETARRLLDADRRRGAAPGQSPRTMRAVALVLALAVPLVAGWVYLTTGAPGYADLPLAQRHALAAELRAARPGQARLEAAWTASPERPAAPEVDAQYMELMDQLRTALENRPNDQRGLRLLAVNEGNLGNFPAAVAAWVRLIDLQGAQAPVSDLTALAEAMVLAAGGLVSPEAEVVLERILQRDPRNGTARYYLGLSFAQTERPDLTFRLWRGLLEDSVADDLWVPAIRAALPDLARIAGVRYTMPEVQASRGPSAADMQAAAGMSDAERAEMIGGMVEGLASRLANQGGPAEDWARLIGALAVLGQQDRARAIWSEARMVFADRAEALAVIDAAARDAGFTD